MSTLALSTLRPLRLVEIFDRAIRLYRSHFIQYIGILAIVQIPLVGLQLLVSLLTVGSTADALTNPFSTPADIFTPDYLVGVGLGVALQFVGFVMLQGVAVAALTRVMAGHYLGEKNTSILDAFRLIRPQLLPIIASSLIVSFLLIMAFVWMLVPCFGWLTGFGILIFLSALVTPMTVITIVVEKQEPLVAWRRAWDLVRNRFWWMLGFALLLGLFGLFTIQGPAAVVGAVGQTVLFDPLNPTTTGLIVQTVIQSLTILLTSLLFIPVQSACFTVLYFDQRIRFEGLDLLLQPSDTEDYDSFRILEETAPDLRPDFMTSQELGYFALITIGFGAFFTLLYFALVVIILAFASAL